jgi:hypothetical protein
MHFCFQKWTALVKIVTSKAMQTEAELVCCREKSYSFMREVRPYSSHALQNEKSWHSFVACSS